MSAQPAVAEYDPFESATNATLRPNTYFALVACDAWPCVLVKGQGKVAFNAQQHKIENRVTAIDISLQPLAEQNVNFPLVRNMIAESPAWIKIVLPSAKALGLVSADYYSAAHPSDRHQRSGCRRGGRGTRSDRWAAHL